jgi:hypothetical protein
LHCVCNAAEENKKTYMQASGIAVMEKPATLVFSAGV